MVPWNRTAYVGDYKPSSQDLAILSFTCGTTSSPKGCPTTKAMLQHRWSKHRQPMRICISSACYRAIHQGTVLWGWLNGGSIVIPSPEYEAKSLLHALKTETCTDIALVPSQVRDIATFMEQEGGKERRQLVRHARLTGDLVDESVVKLCAEVLQPKFVLITLGRTECASNWAPIIPLLTDSNGSFAIGKVAPGSRAKVVNMQSGEPPHIGEIGEVHVSTPCCIDGYLDGRFAELWYQKDGHKRFNTGDLGYFDEQGAMFVTGRSKDVVVCRGITICPSVIEGCLNSVDGIDGSQVVGIPHAHYGAVPVAIVKLRRSMEKEAQAKFFDALNTKVVAGQGELMMLHSIYSSQNLDLQNWPRNSTDKILKSELVARITTLRQ